MLCQLDKSSALSIHCVTTANRMTIASYTNNILLTRFISTLLDLSAITHLQNGKHCFVWLRNFQGFRQDEYIVHSVV